MTTFDTIRLFSKMLRNLDQWLGKAEAHAKNKGFEADVLVGMRLAPDMYELAKQVQSACDSAKFAASYLSGKAPPVHPDNEKTIAELHERIGKALAFVETVSEADLAGAADRKVAPAWLKGSWLRGNDYLVQVAVPNFFFHVTTAYAILRHAGVDVGKMDYIGNLPLQNG